MDMAPAVVVVGFGIAGAYIAMNLLAAAPVAVNTGPTPTPVLSPSLPGSPSALPLVTTVPSVTPFPAASLPSRGPTFVHSYINESDPGGIWIVDLGYPSFVLGSTPWARSMNGDIKDEMEIRVAQWEEGSAAERQVPGKVNRLTGSFTTELLTPALASFTLTWTDDSSATAPSTFVETLNYDLSTGQRIAFDDLFSDTSSALDIMSVDARSLLQNQLGISYDPSLASKGTSALPANYLHWALSPSGLKVTFDQNQVTPGKSLPTILVPWSALRSAMVTTGPVARLAGV